MPKFRKKPIVVEALKCEERQVIYTLEGNLYANVGDWIITGVNGEKYPCKSDIFEKTYEPFNESEKTVERIEFKNCVICPFEGYGGCPHDCDAFWVDFGGEDVVKINGKCVGHWNGDVPKECIENGGKICKVTFEIEE